MLGDGNSDGADDSDGVCAAMRVLEEKGGSEMVAEVVG